MAQVTFGDRATQYRTIRVTHQVKTNLDRLTQEVATGHTTDTAKAVAGNLTPLAGMKRALSTLSSYAIANTEAELAATSMQSVLSTISDYSSEMGTTLLTASQVSQSVTTNATASQARGQFDAIVSAINTRVASRSLFAGVATDANPLADTDTLIADLRVATAAATTASEVVAAVTAWFDDSGGGFETSGYLGSTTPASAFRLSDRERTTLAITAHDQEFRDVLKGFAIAALVDDGVLSGDEPERAQLLSLAGQQILTGEGALANLRSRIGAAEQQIELAKTHNAAEIASYETAIGGMLEIDTFASASALTQVQTQLETIYTITARLSNLNLSDYL
ncbi:flagellar hook-associated protein FlgL [Aquimixticola soesokkakensis]|uniref:Flagellar hook-associated protein FlgL n=1 Tax=Aquimixticola soesokkakensis TaxID=1519096 RepID=A0A1Y5RBR0_9RHOB|nr:flagellin [Aquimixticola soesokkakensis]SLN13659.1 flagellar hook-associated protein FlgL [Aquimixticola soesokkakensis]